MIGPATRARCEQLVRPLVIPDPFDEQVFCDHLAAARGKRIHLVPHKFDDDGLSGLWISTAAADYICYERDTSLLHRRHIILHEIGHLLCDHHPPLATTLQRITSVIDQASVLRVSTRAHCDTKQERQAELIAYLIHARIATNSMARRDSTIPDNGALARIAETLKEPGAH